MKRILFVGMAFSFMLSWSYCEANSPSSLFTECLHAYKSFVFESPPQDFKQHVTQNYVGLLSELNSSSWKFLIVLTLTFHANTIEGTYYLAGNTKHTKRIKGEIDPKGNLILKEILADGDWTTTIFGI
jgi:hypothetical protein